MQSLRRKMPTMPTKGRVMRTSSIYLSAEVPYSWLNRGNIKTAAARRSGHASSHAESEGFFGLVTISVGALMLE